MSTWTLSPGLSCPMWGRIAFPWTRCCSHKLQMEHKQAKQLSYMPSRLLWRKEAEVRLCWNFCFWSKSHILQATFFFLKFLLKLISDLFQKMNCSNVTFLCEHSYVPASPNQVFSKEVTSTGIIKSQDCFQHFPVTSGRCDSWFCTTAVNFTAMV